MKDKNDNPLNDILTQISENKYSPEIKSFKNINNFFNYLNGDNTPESKSKIIEEFIIIIKENRFICEYFSLYENKSIYIFLFELYLQYNSSEILKKSIINLIKELILNIEADKKIFEFLFQKLSLLYREEEELLPESLTHYLTLLNSIISDVESRQKPHNYFCCNGEGNFNINLKELKLSINCGITFIINFKIGKMDNIQNNKIISNLIKINFINGHSINIDLEYPMFLIVKEIKNSFLKILPENEWINLIFTLMGTEKNLFLYFLLNGENHLIPFSYPTTSINYKDNIDSIQFFNNFFGEVSSMTMLSQNKDFETSLLPSNKFLVEFKFFSEGLWKRKKITNFMNLLEKTKIDEINILNFIFLFTPLNKIDYNKENIIESAYGSLVMEYNGNIRLHNYLCYQKKLFLVNMIKNILPIPEMFLIHPFLLNETNFQIFLEIIFNTLKFRKKNMKFFKEYKFFQILSLFIERYPQNIFNEKILEYFWEIGKCIFSSNFEVLSFNYFKHILLNEKIISKYSEDLQVKFWNYLSLFIQSDKFQFSNPIFMNKICLILRYFDRNKYTEFCCKKHLSMIKDVFIENKIIMNPSMNKKLSFLENILIDIISSQDPKNAYSLFKLLTLDLSPCLTLFIINMFFKSFKKSITNEKWAEELIMEFINNKYEVIIINTFLHGLPEIRIEILKLMHEIHSILLKMGKEDFFIPFTKMIKTCLLPQNMFYYSKTEVNDIIRKKHINNELKNIDIMGVSSRLTNKNNIIDNLPTKILNERKFTEEVQNSKNYLLKSVNPNPRKYVEIENDIKNENIDLERISDLYKDLTNNDNKPLDKSLNDNEKNQSNQENILNTSKDNLDQNINNLNDICQANNENNREYNNIENSYFEENNEINGILIFKENLLKDYKDKLFNILYLWAFGFNLENDINKIDFEKSEIKNLSIMKILFIYIKELNNTNYTMKFLEKFQLFISTPQNSYNIFLNKKLYSELLDLSFNYYNKEDNQLSECFNKSKSIILDIFINSILYLEKNDVGNICSDIDIDIIFNWGHEVYERIKDKNKLLDFLNQFLLESLSFLKINFEPKMKINLKDINFKPKTNFYIRNYFIFNTYLFEFCFLFKYELEKNSNVYNPDESSKKLDSELKKYISSMRINNSKNKIGQKWVDLPLMVDIYQKFNYFWGVTSSLQKKFKSQEKGDKVSKYEAIIENTILDINTKNLFLKELELLCFEENIEEIQKKEKEKKEGQFNIIIAPINIITISFMCILSEIENEKDLNYWLKELKYFMRFLIMSSSNLIQNNQIELFNSIKEKIICVISTIICFLNDLVNKFKENNSPFKEKSEKILQKILLFCLLVTKYHYKYISEHKNKLNIFNILGKNNNEINIYSSAVIFLFSDYIKDKNNSQIITQKKLEQLSLNQYNTIIEIFNNPEMEEAFYENKKLKNLIDTKLFILSKFKNIFEERNIKINNIIEDYDYTYKKEILSLLPLYEKELIKFSNNSFENNKKYKNIYKTYKKESFSWLGFWSDRKLFFEKNKQLKFKLSNHFTKTLMKPILSQILDISYYLPKFSGFKVENLFNKPNVDEKIKKTNFQFSLDIDKIIRSSEIKQITMNNIQESFGLKKVEISENYLRTIYKKSNIELAKYLLKISNRLDFGKEEELLINKKDKNSKEVKDENLNKNYYLSCLVKPSHHIKGVFFIDETNIYFRVFLNQESGKSMKGIEIAFDINHGDYDKDRKTCFGSYFVCHPKDKDLYKISINYDDIKWFFRRRYYYQDSGLEIYTKTNKSYYFNFKFEEDRENVINEILSKIKDYTKIIDDLKEVKDNYDNIIGYDNTFENKKAKIVKISKKIDSWKEWEISNFELIMWLNVYGNRSYNDLSQYPVFPWILNNYDEPIKGELTRGESDNNLEQKKDGDEIYENGIISKEKFRDLNLPIGMLAITEEAKNRAKLFLQSYENLKRDSNQFIIPYMFGSNYSNPTFVCNYMTRIFPYTHIGIELQGNKFDDPNRLFNSVRLTFKNAISHKSDVRELIPEFFYFPEIYININDLDMGIKLDGTKVNNVETPCNNNPYEFTILLRNLLEKDTVSYNINNWIDLIFGYKNKGKEAKLANNLFTNTSYQEDVDLKKAKNRDLFLRYAEFGLIPNQLMSKECEKKIKREEKLKGNEITNPKDGLNIIECRQSNTDNSQYIIENNSKVLLIKYFSEGKISILLNNFIYIEKKISKFNNEEIVNYINLKEICNKDTLINSISEFYSETSDNNKCLRFFHKGKFIIMGGFYDGKLVIFSIENKKNNAELYPFIEEKPILCIEIDKEENYIFLGNSIGNIRIYQMENDFSKWKMIHFKTDNISPINHINCSNDLNLWTSTTLDGYINIYTLPLCKLTRCLKVSTNKCSYSFLSSSPLPSIIIINQEENNNEILSYSINGNLMFKKQENYHLLNPILIKDIYSFEYLAYIGRDNIIIRKLPNLETQIKIDDLPGIHIFCISEDNKAIYALDKNGKKITVIKT